MEIVHFRERKNMLRTAALVVLAGVSVLDPASAFSLSGPLSYAAARVTRPAVAPTPAPLARLGLRQQRPMLRMSGGAFGTRTGSGSEGWHPRPFLPNGPGGHRVWLCAWKRAQKIDAVQALHPGLQPVSPLLPAFLSVSMSRQSPGVCGA